MSSGSRFLNIAAFGDEIADKTAMLTTYITNEFPIDYVPTQFISGIRQIKVDGKEFSFSIWDTSGTYTTITIIILRPLNACLNCISV